MLSCEVTKSKISTKSSEFNPIFSSFKLLIEAVKFCNPGRVLENNSSRDARVAQSI